MALSNSDISLIQEHAYNSGHNFYCYRYIYGEPFLLDGILHYYDGKLLTINTNFLSYPVNALTTKLSSISYLIDKYKPDIILLAGQRKENSMFLDDKEWVFVDCENMPPFTQDVVLLLNNFDMNRISGLTINIKLAKSKGITTANHAAGQFSARHIQIIQKFIASNNPDSLDVTCSVLSAMISNKHVRLIEAWYNDALQGFLILDNSLPRLSVILGLFFNEFLITPMDLLLTTTVNYCIETECSKLALGPSRDQDLYRYKMKWGDYRLSEIGYKYFYYRKTIPFNPEKHSWLLRALGS